MSTVVVRGSGGAVFAMDVPASGHALDRWNEQIAKGDLVVIDESAPAPEPEEDSEPEPEAVKPAPAPRKRAAKTDPKG